MPDDEGSNRLWLTEPGRSTSLAEVIETRGEAFRLDRTLFRPKSRTYRHPQRHDVGTVWVKGGDKHRLSTVYEQGGHVWHRTDGETPPVDAKLQCHLDQDQRALDSRAHTGMHLLLAAMHQLEAPPLVADPEVKGGGRFRLEVRAWDLDEAGLASWVDRARSFIDADERVEVSFVPRDAVHHRLDAQRFEEGERFPGPGGSLRAVRVGEVCAYPCDGTHVDWTSEVGGLLIRDTHVGEGGRWVIVGEVPPSR